ncbi:MAG TPA: HPP family protein [Rhodopila sp.]|nr:HPP family protein [Rhodopila sp.]
MTLKLEHFLAAVAALAILVLIGAIGIWTHHPWLVPSLGAAAFLQTMSPEIKTARPWNIFVGQLLAVAGGYAGVFAVGAQSAPSLASGHPLLWVRIAAVAVGIAVTVLLQHMFRAENPTGGATTLLIALGSEPATWGGVAIMLVGVTLVSLLGETARFSLLAVRKSTARPTRRSDS